MFHCASTSMNSAVSPPAVAELSVSVKLVEYDSASNARTAYNVDVE